MRIQGNAETRVVLVDGQPLDPKPSQRVWNHSPDGFAWGYAGSGPAQLALAILLHAGVERDLAVHLHQRFKFAYVQRWQDDFDVVIDFPTWMLEQGKRDGAASRDGDEGRYERGC